MFCIYEYVYEIIFVLFFNLFINLVIFVILMLFLCWGGGVIFSILMFELSEILKFVVVLMFNGLCFVFMILGSDV